MKLTFRSEQLLWFDFEQTVVHLEEKNITEQSLLFSGQTVWLDSGTLAQEERRVPAAHAQERWEQRWAQGSFNRLIMFSSEAQTQLWTNEGNVLNMTGGAEVRQYLLRMNLLRRST